MLNGRRFVIDTMSEVYSILKDFADEEFWDFTQVVSQPGSIYLLGRQQLLDNMNRVRAMCEDPSYIMVFAGSAEGSSTHREQCARVLKIGNLIEQGKLLLITGGDMAADWPHIVHDHFLCRILDFEDNLPEMSRINEIYGKTKKPYKFLFLNGRGRPHRKYLWERFRLSGLLDHSLWTMLDGRSSSTRYFQMMHDGQDLMCANTPITHLPPRYEVSRYHDNWERYHADGQKRWYPHHFAKFDVFNNEWGEIYLRAEPYIDTYFSLVTETVFEYPYSFRTEKIAKPLAQGHPWICATSQGWYKDLRDLGFKTFDSLIDESFDLIDHHQSRMDRIYQIITDLCQQDLSSFLRACKSICKYNQQHLVEFQQQHRQEFPGRFQHFLSQHARH
jgi:hypothetical protein